MDEQSGRACRAAEKQRLKKAQHLHRIDRADPREHGDETGEGVDRPLPSR